MRNFSILLISLFAILLFFSGCDESGTTTTKKSCLTVADCNKGTECRFDGLENEKGVCVAMTKCESAAECDGRQCNQSLVDNTMYCGYSAEPFGINSATLPDGLVGETYTFTLTVKGSAAPFYFEMKEGSVLPSGLTLSENGVISGTPAEAKTNYSFDVVAFNGAKGSEYFYNYRKVEATFTINITDDACANVNCGEKPNSHCVEGLCVCDENYHANGELCESNTKMVDCDDAAPENATSVIEQVEVTWNNGEWSQPARCGWECNTDYTVEAGTSCINKKMTTCKDAAPENATSVIADVEISYTTADGWAEPANCVWNCNESFHLNGEVCESNTQMVACLENGAPANADYVNISVEITWNNGEWSTAANCAWTCNTNYHTEDNLTCISNTKQVACTQSGAPSNASYTAGNVNVTWNGSSWTTAANCAWTCNANYHTEDNLTCTSNTKQVACTQSGAPSNASYTAGNVNVTWNGSSWTTAANCAWTCNVNYHTEDNLTCTGNTKSVACLQNGAPANSEYVDGIVEVNWVNNQWTTPANCFWNCVADYHEENGSCVPDETGPCAGNPCAEETNSTGICTVTGETTYTCGCVENYFYDDISGNCETACDPLFNSGAPDCSGTNQHCEATSLTLASCKCDDGYVDIDATTALNCQEAYNGNDICDATAPIIDTDGVYLGSTADAIDNYGQDGKDVYYQLVLTQPSIVDIWMESLGTGFDTVLYLNQSCSATAYLYYNDDSTLHGGVGAKNSSFVTGVLPAGTYFIIADGWFDYSYGLFNLHVDITSYEDVCANNPCTEANKSVCTQTGATTFTCSCDSGYYASGTACVNPCDSVTCPTVNGNGTCTATSATAYSCGCSNGYFYDSTTNSCINPCDTATCTENSTCSATSVTAYSCNCNAGYVKVGTACVQSYQGADTCTEPSVIINAPGTYVGTITTANTNSTHGNACAATSTGKEVVYQLVVPQDSFVTINETGLMDTVLYLRNECMGTTDVVCTDTPETISRFLTAGTYYLFMDVWSATTTGNYILTVDMANPCNPNTCPDVTGNGTGVCTPTSSTAFTCGCNTGYHFEMVNSVATCVQDPVILGNTCSDLMTTITASGNYTGNTNTVGYTNNFTATCGTTTNSSKDMVFKLELTQTSNIVLDITTASFSDSLMFFQQPCGTTIECDDDDGTGSLSRIARNNVPAGTYYVVVDGYNSTNSGTFNLSVTITPLCGNGTINAPEQCDGANLNSQTCVTQGFDGGTLGCTSSCTFDTTQCTINTEYCGNNVIDGTDECDGTDIIFNCDDFQTGYVGSVSCNADCTMNYSLCTPSEYCGNGVVDGDDECDGADIVFTCNDYQAGYVGTTTCNADCTTNYSQCTAVETCGDGVINQPSEDCDGMDIIFTCDDYQTGYVGTVTCNSDCTMNYSQCSNSVYCGNGIADGDDECDGTDFVFSCDDYQAGYVGPVSCNSNCTIDYSSCSPAGVNIGWCSTQWPLTFTVDAGTESPTLYGQVWSNGVTSAAGAPNGITAQLCYTTDPTLETGVTCMEAIWDQQVGNNDQFATWITIATAGTYYYYYEFSGNGVNWVKCDLSNEPNNGTDYNGNESFQGVVGTATVNGGAVENCSDNIDNDGDTFADCLDSDCVNDDNCVDLFISEYIEGSGNNKAIEIYNPKSVAVDLSDYSIKYHVNSAIAATTVLLSTCTTSIPSHGTIVIYNSSAVVGISSKGTCTNATIAGFNGDDTLELFKISSNVTIDLFGNIGTDPGTAWAVAGILNGTAEHSLVRKPSIKKGNPVNLSSFGTDVDNSEWIVYPQDDFTYLGTHSVN